jgi:hypothetical protein
VYVIHYTTHLCGAWLVGGILVGHLHREGETIKGLRNMLKM